MIYKKIEIKVEGYQETADLYTYILDNSGNAPGQEASGRCDLPGRWL